MASEDSALFASFQDSPQPIFVTDRSNHIVHWNRQAEQIFGFAAADMLGRSCSEELSGCDVAGNRYCSEHCPLIHIATRGEAIRHFVLRLRSRDGAVHAFDVNIVTLVGQQPGHFFLAHVLTSSVDAAPPAWMRPAPPPPVPRDAAQLSPDQRARRLTTREVEILGMLAAGQTGPAMAERLHIARATVRNHVQNILDKLEVHSKAEAVAFAFQKHLV